MSCRRSGKRPSPASHATASACATTPRVSPRSTSSGCARRSAMAQIDLYGASYGTRMAELYLRHHAAAVQAVVLDGVTYPEQAIGPDTPLDGERALDLILGRCRAAPECAAAYPDLRRDFGALAREVRSRLGVVDPARPRDGRAARARVQSRSARRGVALAVLQLHPSIAPAHADPSGLLGPPRGARRADRDDGPRDPRPAGERHAEQRRVQRGRAVLRRASIGSGSKRPTRAPSSSMPSRRSASSGRRVRWMRICTPRCTATCRPCSCRARPIRLRRPRMPERLAQGLAHHRLLVLPGEGHGQLATGCMPRLVAAFLDARDPQALDAACLEEHRPAPFFVGSTGPAP